MKRKKSSQDRGASDKLRIASLILSYLVENPDAQDTLEGILQWWLLQQRISYEEKRVREALEELVAKGMVEKVAGPDKREFYRINRGNYDEIQDFLEQMIE